MSAMGQPALDFGQQDGLVGAEDRGALSHERNARKYNDITLYFGCSPGKFERVAREIRYLLYFVPLVVVSEDKSAPKLA